MTRHLHVIPTRTVNTTAEISRAFPVLVPVTVEDSGKEK